jgi:hypothetical protein
MLSTLQVFLLGLMAALTPSFLVLAWMLWRVPLDSSERAPPLPNARANAPIAKRRRLRRTIMRFRKQAARRMHRR